MNLGLMARQRAISVRRRSPPERLLPRLWRTFSSLNSRISCSSFSLLILGGSVGHLEDGPYIVFDGECPEHRGLLRQIAYAALRASVDRKPGDVGIIYEDPSLVGGNESYCHIESCGLAGSLPVGPEQSYDLSLRDVDGDFVGHCALAVLLYKILGAEDTFLGNPHFFLYTDCAFRSGYGIRGVNVEFLHVGHGESLQIALLFGSECTWTFLAALAPGN